MRARPEDTDWAGIEGLYRQLMVVSTSPVIALNHAVAVAMSRGLEEGLQLLEELAAGGELAGYARFYTTRAELASAIGPRQRGPAELRARPGDDLERGRAQVVERSNRLPAYQARHG